MECPICKQKYKCNQCFCNKHLEKHNITPATRNITTATQNINKNKKKYHKPLKIIKKFNFVSSQHKK